MARELFDTPWIKLEVIGDADTLQPDVFGLVEAARILAQDGFEVFPTRPRISWSPTAWSRPAAAC